MITSTELAGRLSELAEKFSVTGASAALWHDGVLVRAETGTANVVTGAPVRADTLFAAGSVTKVFTSSLAMTLVDEGLLDLDAPVRAYLPDFTSATPERSDAITVRMLFTHSSGLAANHLPDLPPGDDVLERLMVDLATLPVTGVPGERWCYSNAGMGTLGRLVEVITGERYDAALRSRILEPLGLNATPDAEELLLRSTAVGHVVDPVAGTTSPVARLRLGPENGPAGSRLWLDADALIRFGRTHLDGTAPGGRRILSPEALELMRTPQFDDYWGCLPLYVNWGLGWAILQEGPELVIGHAGANNGMFSNLVVIPERKVVLAVLANSQTGGQLVSALCTDILGELFDVRVPEPVQAPESAVEVVPEPFAGRYASPDGEVVVDVRDGRLHLELIRTPALLAWERLMGSPGEDGQALPLVCVDAERRRFVLELGAPGAVAAVRFLAPGPDGRPTLVRSGTLYERIA